MKRIFLLACVFCGAAAAQQNCSVNTVAGTYVISYMGWLTMTAPDTPPLTASGGIFGVTSIDWNGTVQGVAAVSGLGPVTDYEVSGTVQVNPDCTGTIRMTGKPKGSAGPSTMTEVDRFVFVPDTNELRLIITDMGPGAYPALLGTWKRIARQPYSAQW